jgi:hypothetical protein
VFPDLFDLLVGEFKRANPQNDSIKDFVVFARQYLAANPPARIFQDPQGFFIAMVDGRTFQLGRSVADAQAPPGLTNSVPGSSDPSNYYYRVT